MTSLNTPTTTTNSVYECPDCGEQTTERRCPDCHLFTRRLGPGGHCPSCDELVLIDDILTNQARSTTETYTEDLTGSGSVHPLDSQRAGERLSFRRVRIPPSGGGVRLSRLEAVRRQVRKESPSRVA